MKRFKLTHGSGRGDILTFFMETAALYDQMPNGIGSSISELRHRFRDGGFPETRLKESIAFLKFFAFKIKYWLEGSIVPFSSERTLAPGLYPIRKVHPGPSRLLSLLNSNGLNSFQLIEDRVVDRVELQPPRFATLIGWGSTLLFGLQAAVRSDESRKRRSGAGENALAI